MTPDQALAGATRRLTEAGIDGAARDARRLLAHVLDCAASDLILRRGDDLSETALAAFDAAVTARAARKPVAQIVGWRDFHGRRFKVTPEVLDPRPDTETLIAAALDLPWRNVLDLGTGSGCILLTLLAERPGTTGLGVDVSEAALAVAGENGRALGIAARFAPSDWFASLDGVFDLIVSNPPYIAESELAGLSPEVRDHEPLLALSPGGDGLDAYRRIARGAAAHLAPDGHLVVEIGATQGPSVTGILGESGFRDLRLLQDLDGRDRVVVACAPI